MRVALDTNVMAYAEGVGDSERCRIARDWIERLPPESVLLPAQTTGELYRVLVSKAGRSAQDARGAILEWTDAFELADSTVDAFQAAMDLAVDHQLRIWDGLILAVAAENHCRLLLSEDFQDGFTWHATTVTNPFAATPHPLLTALMEE